MNTFIALVAIVLVSLVGSALVLDIPSLGGLAFLVTLFSLPTMFIIDSIQEHIEDKQHNKILSDMLKTKGSK